MVGGAMVDSGAGREYPGKLTFFSTRRFGRKWPVFDGGVTFLVGAALNGAAENVFMLILGRILLGIGIGIGVFF